jgi:2-phosphosulfolactate phosphatase
LNIRIESLIAGAERAVGTVVIIDVFRAFATAAVALANGATKIIMVRDVEEALALQAAGVGQLCMGEIGGYAPSRL